MTNSMKQSGGFYHPKQYFHNSDFQRQQAERALARINLEGTENILDFGCGDGKVTTALSFRIPKGEIDGVDQSEEMIDFANAKYPNDIYRNLRFSKIDIGETSPKTQSRKYDYIVSFNTLHHVQDHRSVYAEFHKKLSDNGTLLIAYPKFSNTTFQAAMRQSIQEVIQKYKIEFQGTPFKGGKPAVPVSDSNELKILLTELGFRHVDFEEVNSRYVFVDDDEYINWIKGSSPFRFGIAESEENKLYLDLIDKCTSLDESMRVNERGLAISSAHLIIHARKN